MNEVRIMQVIETRLTRRGDGENNPKWAQQEAQINENRRRAEKAAKTRLKNRIAKGVCPCCNRTFQNLGQHMANQHPDYANSES